MRKKIKLAIVIKNIDGGTGTFLNQLFSLESIYNNSLEIYVLSLQKEQNIKIAQFKKVVYFSRTKKTRNYYAFAVSEVLILFKEFIWLKKNLRDIEPDIILSIDTHCNILSSWVKMFFEKNAKLVITTHNNISAVFARKLSPYLLIGLKIMGKYLFNKADVVICVSKGASDNFRKFFSIKQKVNTVYYGLSNEQIKTLEKKTILKKDEKFFSNKNFKIISAGRLDEQKDFTTLIKSFLIIKKQIENSVLLIIGDGKQKSVLKKLTHNLKIDSSVYFLGWKKNIFPYIRHSDVFVLSSEYEGFGLVLIEAMSQGIPVISTDTHYGPSEILDNGKYGVLVKKSNPLSLAKSVIELRNNKDQYQFYGKKALERSRFFSQETMLVKYKKILDALL